MRSVAFWTLAALGTSLACGSRAHAGVQTPGTGRIHAEIRDTSVDALPHVSIPVSPDLVLAAVDVGTADLVFRFRFRPGSFDPVTTRLTVEFDIDQNTTTGTSGVEYEVRIVPAGGRGADVVSTVHATEMVAGRVPVSAVDDGYDVSIPRRLLGEDDGRFDFRVRVYAEQALPLVLDVLPDVGFVRVQ